MTEPSSFVTEGMYLSNALGDGGVRVCGDGFSIKPMRSIGYDARHSPGDMGTQIAQQAPQPVVPTNFFDGFKPV